MPRGILIEPSCTGSSMVDPMLDNVEIQSNLYDNHCHICSTLQEKEAAWEYGWSNIDASRTQEDRRSSQEIPVLSPPKVLSCN